MSGGMIQVASPLPLYTRDSYSSSSSSSGDYHETASLRTPGHPTIAIESRRDRDPSSIAPDTFPPNYIDSNRDIAPEYTATYEPVTSAMYLFHFGFLFPPFWILGAFILVTPLRFPYPSHGDKRDVGTWLPEKTKAEQQAFAAHIRTTELKYAKRCLTALLLLCICVALFVGLAVWVTR